MKGIKIKNLKSQKIFQNTKFNFLSKLRSKVNVLLNPDPYEYNPAFIDTNLAMYTQMRHFQAYLTKNAYDMSVFNEYDTWPHVNFGTIDNPVLVFGAGTTWRMVACSGPGSEEESSSHEKMYMIVREGPIHRCVMCGQCFKLLKLKDNVVSEENMYYSNIFTQIPDHELVQNVEDLSPYTFGLTVSDPRDWRSNIIPKDRTYAFVNSDEADHIMVDPAFRMEFYKNIEIDLIKRGRVGSEILRQAELAGIEINKKIKMEKDVYETWIKIEKEILRFNRIFNRNEKFLGRALFDPLNHERRERRMLERKSERETENYTFYAGGLTEEEQMYRDYYESDLEEFPDEEFYNEKLDSNIIASRGEFKLDKYDLAEENTLNYSRTPVESILESLIFKHKYRDVSDIHFDRRTKRVSNKAFERAKTRDSKVVKDLGDIVEEIYVRKSNYQCISGKEEELLPYSNYIAEEGYQQFKDYYQTDIENGVINGDLLNDLSERDRIKFSECYLNDLNKSLITDKQYILIPKRPYNPNESIVQNFILDLLDFNFRVRPISRNLVFRDVSSKFQPIPLNDEEKEIDRKDNDRYRPVLEFKKTATHKFVDDNLLGNNH